MFFLDGLGRAAYSGGISGLGYGVSLLPLGRFAKVGVNSFFGGLSNVAGLDPESKLSISDAAIIGVIVGNIPIPSKPLNTLVKNSKTILVLDLFYIFY